MDAWKAAALAALVGGLALVTLGVVEGDVRVGLFLIVPFVYGTGPLPALGMLLVFAAPFLWFIGAARHALPPERPGAHEPPPHAGEAPRRRGGGIVLIGPIPIVWGSDRRVVGWMVAAGAAFLVLALLVFFVLSSGPR